MDFEILPGVTYIGVDDYDLELFENQYKVPKGISYNSYVVKGEKIAVVDTTDEHTGAMWLANLSDALGTATPDYLVIEHLEPDHSSLITEFVNRYPEATIVMSAAAARMLPLYAPGLPAEVKTLVVKEGDELSLGADMTMKFIMAPMVHWPEVMMVYLPERKLLFSADAFGTFGTLDNQIDDWSSEARRYYFNIVGKYGQQVQNVLAKLSSLEINVICPLHGPVLRNDIAHYTSLYDKWSSYKPEESGVLVASASIHGNTRQAADYVARKLKSEGVGNVVVADLTRSDMSEAVANAFRYPKMVLCASSYDAGLFTPMYDFLHILQSKGYRDRTVGLVENGSWTPSAAKVMKGMLEEMKDIAILPDTVTLRGTVKESDYQALDRLVASLKK